MAMTLEEAMNLLRSIDNRLEAIEEQLQTFEIIAHVLDVRGFINERKT